LTQATKAGITIGRLRNHQNKEIASRATQVVAKWKKCIEAQKQKAKQAIGTPSSTGSGAAKTGSPAPSTLSPPAVGTPKTFSGDPEKRTAATDGMEARILASSHEKARTNCIKLMYNGLAFRCTADCDTVFVKAVAVEDAAFKYFKGATADYRKKIASLFQNLKAKSNVDLGRRVMGGEIGPERFVVMSHQELMSAERKKMDEELEKQNMKNAQVPMVEKSISKEFKCGKCGERKVSYSQAQTRSADEPMTTFCECMHCGNRWKVSGYFGPDLCVAAKIDLLTASWTQFS
jgi:transcription elongation factor S-II